MFKRLIREDISLNLDLSTRDLYIEMDRNQLMQVLLNVIVNARDALGSKGGNIIITTSLTLGPNDKLSRVGTSTESVLISIKDDGIGMSKEIKSKIFDPFFTTKAVGKGTGLGMSVVYGIIQQQKGMIDIISEPLKGTEIQIFLPVSNKALNEDEKQEDSIDFQIFQDQNITILLIEDDLKVLDYTKKILGKYNLKVLPASKSEEARYLYHKHKSEISMIVSDVILSDGNGVDLVKELIESETHAKVLFYSGYSDESSQKEIILDKGFHFIQKPFQLNDFILKIKQILELV